MLVVYIGHCFGHDLAKRTTNAHMTFVVSDMRVLPLTYGVHTKALDTDGTVMISAISRSRPKPGNFD
jgi:hypothetical protein